MNPEEFLRILDAVEPLKNNTRHSWTSTGRHESVAEHSWRLTLMAFLAKGEFPGADMEKVLHMCLIHDIGEAFTGDIPSFTKTADDEAVESARLAAWVKTLPAPLGREFAALYEEMDALETREAKIYKALDNLEAVAQHNEAPLSTWLPLEYELQLSYGGDKVAFDPWLTALKAQLNAETRAKIKAEKPAAEKA
ncbi:MAG: HD domain-containing protein [Faecalibacterium sp.]|jgi:putative hydrolase of HD superfamily|nr:HD domain-containing protein [Faecalibacterium sp.]